MTLTATEINESLSRVEKKVDSLLELADCIKNHFAEDRAQFASMSHRLNKIEQNSLLIAFFGCLLALSIIVTYDAIRGIL